VNEVYSANKELQQAVSARWNRSEWYWWRLDDDVRQRWRAGDGRVRRTSVKPIKYW